MLTFKELPECRMHQKTADDFASIVPSGGGVKIAPSSSTSVCTSTAGVLPVLTSSKVSPFRHLTTHGGAEFASLRASASCRTPDAVRSAASTMRAASSLARSASAFAAFEMFDRHHETAAPMAVATAQAALTQFGMSHMSSSSVRCEGGCIPACATHLTGEDPRKEVE